MSVVVTYGDNLARKLSFSLGLNNGALQEGNRCVDFLKYVPRFAIFKVEDTVRESAKDTQEEVLYDLRF